MRLYVEDSYLGSDGGPSQRDWAEMRDFLAILMEGQANGMAKLATLQTAIVGLTLTIETLTQEEQSMSESITDYASALVTLSQDVASNSSAVDSAVAVLAGLQKQLGEEIAKAAAAQATPEQLAGLNALHQQLQAKSDMLAKAIAAGTEGEPDMTPTDVASTPDAPVEPAPEQPVVEPTPDPAPTGDAPTDAPADPATAEQPAPEIDQTTGQPVPPTDATA